MIGTWPLIALIIIFLVTSTIGVVTGSNSLITVPVMFQFGIDPKVAIATNMFGLTFMSIGAVIPFIRQNKIDRQRIVPLCVITLISSTIGALLVNAVSDPGIKAVVSAAMILVILFTLLRPGAGTSEAAETTSYVLAFAYVLTFLLGIYGGFYSGGYVTILTAVCVAFFGMRYGVAVGTTKLINLFSCAAAVAIFMWQGLVDYKLGAILAVTMFIGGYIGGHYASRFDDVWLKRIFLTTVLLLAAKTIYDFL